MADSAPPPMDSFPYTYYVDNVSGNYAGALWVTSLLSLIYPVLSAMLRFFIKKGAYSPDDWILLGATGASVAQHIALFISLASGMAKLGGPFEDSIDIVSAEKALLASNILFILTHAGAKISMAILTRRLFNSYSGTRKIACNALIGLTLLWPIFAILIIFPGCSIASLSTTTGKCDGLLPRWVIVALVDGVSEIILTLIPALLVKGLMMKTHSKLIVMAAFAPRLILLVLSGVLAYTVHENLDADSNMAYVFLVVFTQCLLAWSLVSASLPCFRAIIKPFDAIAEHGSYPTNHDNSAAANLYRGHQKCSQASAYAVSGNASNGIRSGNVSKIASKRRSTDEARLLDTPLQDNKVIRVDFHVEVS